MDKFVSSNSSDRGMRVAICGSTGLRNLRHLAKFLGVDRIVDLKTSDQLDTPPVMALVWGRKSSGESTLAFARERGIPVRYLEDGWIRTCSANAHSRTCYSLQIDEIGVYYDASQPSGIEQFLSSDQAVAQACSEPVLSQARAWRERLVGERITKYNAYRRTPLDEPVPETPFALVIDQTRDDSSVVYGGMKAENFELMLRSALDEYGADRVVVRSHPDVVAGRRSGYLADTAHAYGVRVVAGIDSPLDWIKSADRLYVGTSQLGYEAVLSGKQVSVFGMPFYAGWGLTDDRLRHDALQRRGQQRTVDELFFAAHVRQIAYRSPVDGSHWTLGDCMDHVALQRYWFEQNAHRFHGVAIAPWKRRYIAQYLRSPDGSVSFGSQVDPDADVTVTWSFRNAGGKALAQRSVSNDCQTPCVWRIEDGFLRSSGLGSDFTAPGSLVFDRMGLYFDPQTESDLETLLNEHDCTSEELERARQLRMRLLENGISKYNLGAAGKISSAGAAKHRVLVVGQVEDDESVKRGCNQVSSNTELLQAVRKARPDAWIVYRPHPDVVSGNRKGYVAPSCLAMCADEVDVDSAVATCIESCNEIHTMTSLIGFEALLREMHVVTWGAPFYSGWGLTEDRVEVPRRSRKRTLGELVYLVMIEYPRYLDIDSGEFVKAESMVDILVRQRSETKANRGVSWTERQLGRVNNAIKGLTYAP